MFYGDRPRFIKFGQKFGAPSAWNLAAQKHELSALFRTTSRLDREYLRNATRYRQWENGVANYGHSGTGNLNSVYFGPQIAKNRTEVLTHPPAIVQRIGVSKSVAFARWQHAHPTGGHQAGHWHASSINYAPLSLREKKKQRYNVYFGKNHPDRDTFSLNKWQYRYKFIYKKNWKNMAQHEVEQFAGRVPRLLGYRSQLYWACCTFVRIRMV